MYSSLFLSGMKRSINIGALLILVCIAIVISYSAVPSAIAATRLGLHVTQEELNIWRQRMVNGPYKSGSRPQPCGNLR
jgi:hypothetical protein